MLLRKNTYHLQPCPKANAHKNLESYPTGSRGVGLKKGEKTGSSGEEYRSEESYRNGIANLLY